MIGEHAILFAKMKESAQGRLFFQIKLISKNFQSTKKYPLHLISEGEMFLTTVNFQI